MNRLMLAAVLLAAPALGAKPAKIPKDAPFCVPADAPFLFLSPMGEPFRGKGGEAYPSAAWFAGADANGDSRLSADEFVRDAQRFFAKLDRDHDAALIPDEIALYERDVPEIALYRGRPEGPRRGGEGGGPGGRPDERRGTPAIGRDEGGYGGAMGAGRFSFLNVPHPIWSADADIDRAVTAAEFAAAARRRFALLDPTARGYLTLADLPKPPQQAERAGPCRPRPAPKPGEAPRR